MSFEKMDELYASKSAPRHFRRAVTTQEGIAPHSSKVEEGFEHVEATNSS
jgi:hypothetical protein